MFKELEKIVNLKQDNFRNIFNLNDKSDKKDENIDASQIKDSSSKETYHNEVRLVEFQSSIPVLQQQTNQTESSTLDKLEKREASETSFGNYREDREKIIDLQNDSDWIQYNDLNERQIQQKLREDLKKYKNDVKKMDQNHPLLTTQNIFANRDFGLEGGNSLEKFKKEDKFDKIDFVEKTLNWKADFITLKKQVNNIEDLNPLKINIEQISQLQPDIQITDSGQFYRNTDPLTKEDIENQIDKKKKEIRSIVLSDQTMPEKKRNKMNKFVDELFRDNLEIDSLVSMKETLSQTTNQLNQKFKFNELLSHQSLNFQESIEINDCNFFRDLGPLSRKLNKYEDEERREMKKLQKKILTNHIDIEPNQSNLNEDMYLLALSGLVPIEKRNISQFNLFIVVKRMNRLNKWEILLPDEHHFQEVLETSRSSNESRTSSLSSSSQERELLKKQKSLKKKGSQNNKNQQSIEQTKQQQISILPQSEHLNNFTTNKTIESKTSQNDEDIDKIIEQQREKVQKSLGIENSPMIRNIEIDTTNGQNNQLQDSLKKAHLKGQSANFNGTNQDLSVISELNQSAGESILNNDILKSFIKRDQETGKKGEDGGSKDGQKDIIIRIINIDQEVSDRLNTMDQYIKTKVGIIKEQDLNGQQKKSLNNVKTIQKVIVRINKKIEAILKEIIAILDQNNNSKEDGQQQLQDETILKAAVVESEEIDEQVKAVFLTRIFSEYRKNRGRAKQEHLKEQIDKQNTSMKKDQSINRSPKHTNGQESAVKRMELSTQAKLRVKASSQSPEWERSKVNQEGTTLEKKKGKSKNKLYEEVSVMHQGWGVNQSLRKKMSPSRDKADPPFVIQQPQRKIFNQTKTQNNLRYKNNFAKPKKKKSQQPEQIDPPRKQPMRSQVIKYSPATALMNNSKRIKDSTNLDHKQPKKNTKQKKHIDQDQDESPGEAWIGEDQQDFLEEGQWIQEK